MKKIFPGFIFSLFLVFGFVVANAQNNVSDLTWSELKTQQNAERTSMENRQKDELQKLQEAHKLEIETVQGNTGPLQSVAQRYSQERVILAKIHADERKDLAKIHADERKTFLQINNLKNTGLIK